MDHYIDGTAYHRMIPRLLNMPRHIDETEAYALIVEILGDAGVWPDDIKDDVLENA